jgi:hypothetical protein
VIHFDKLGQGLYFTLLNASQKRHKNAQEVVLDRRRSKSKKTQKYSGSYSLNSGSYA